MNLFYKNIYSNLVQQKFSTPSNLISTKISFEIKFEGVENLADESVLKSFYFFFLIFNRVSSFEQFSSRYHLGKTFYKFKILLNFRVLSFHLFLSDLLCNNLSEPTKLTFNSSIFRNNLYLSLSDLKSFYLVESNPHFFKWEKELLIYCSIQKKCPVNKNLNFYFWNIENLKLQKFTNFWSYYVS